MKKKTAIKVEKKKDNSDQQLETIKRLLALIALKTGASPEEVAKVLGVNRSRISQLFAVPKTKKIK